MVKRKPQHGRRREERAAAPSGGRRRPRHGPARGGPAGGSDVWLYGGHAVLAALANPARRIRRFLVTEEAAERLGEALARLLAARRGDCAAARASPRDLAELLPEGAVHQGLALRAAPLEQPDLNSVIAGLDTDGEAAPRVVLVLDQVTDPQNVGAILRSGGAFGVAAVLTTRRHAAGESGALAKAASGALEHLPYVQETNLARALERLREAGFLTVGLAAEAETPLCAVEPPPRLALVLGAEGSGLRRLTREGCDRLARLPTAGPIPHLNVSSAAAVALYEFLGRPHKG